jgi:hypothetical protein
MELLARVGNNNAGVEFSGHWSLLICFSSGPKSFGLERFYLSNLEGLKSKKLMTTTGS